MLAGSAEENTDRPPVLSLLEVPEGFEAATAALFDGELSAPLLPSDREARDVTSGWVALAPLAETAALPAGVRMPSLPRSARRRLSARRLGQAGWVRAKQRAGNCSRNCAPARVSSTETGGYGAGTVSPGSLPPHPRPPKSCGSATG